MLSRVEFDQRRMTRREGIQEVRGYSTTDLKPPGAGQDRQSQRGRWLHESPESSFSGGVCLHPRFACPLRQDTPEAGLP